MDLTIKLKRVYDLPELGDGRRILMDRLWPRGLKKEEARIDEWMKELAPSDKLRKWFSHDPAKWNEFKLKYMKELEEASKRNSIKKLAQKCRSEKVTLLYAAKDDQHNNAMVLKEFLERYL